MCDHCKETGTLFITPNGKFCAICRNAQLCVTLGSKKAQVTLDARRVVPLD